MLNNGASADTGISYIWYRVYGAQVKINHLCTLCGRNVTIILLTSNQVYSYPSSWTWKRSYGAKLAEQAERFDEMVTDMRRTLPVSRRIDRRGAGLLASVATRT
jgi:hypothetical protein